MSHRTDCSPGHCGLDTMSDSDRDSGLRAQGSGLRVQVSQKMAQSISLSKRGERDRFEVKTAPEAEKRDEGAR